jgi:N-acetyltransferase 10
MFADLGQSELQLPVSQALALFAKLVRKVSLALKDIQKAAVSADLPPALTAPRMPALEEAQKPLPDLDEELEQAGEEAKSDLRTKQKAFIESLDLSQ